MASVENTLTAPGFFKSAASYPNAPVVTPEMFDRLAGSGPSHDDTPAYLAALNAISGFAGYVTDLPWKTYYLNTGLVMPAGSIYEGRGQLVVGNSGLSGITLSGAQTIINGIKIKGHAGSTSIGVSAPRCRIYRPVFSGSTVYHLAVESGGDYAFIENPQVLPSAIDIVQNANIQVDSCNEWMIVNPVLNNTWNFGIQISAFNGANSGGTVLNPCHYAEMFSPATQTGDGSTVNFTFIQPQQTNRNAVWLNGVVQSGSQVTITNPLSDGITWKVAFTSAPPNGAVIQFVGWSSLECFNINGPVTDLSIIGGDLNGSGDSGIVLGDDQSLGSPSRVSVLGTKIRNMCDAGISEDTTACSGSVYQADITDCSLGEAPSVTAFSCGVSMGGTSGIWRGGRITNTAAGKMTSGVVLNGPNTTENGSVEKPMIVGPTEFDGTFTNKFFIGQESLSQLVGGIDLQAKPLIPYPGNVMTDLTASWTSPGVPNNSTLLNYSTTVGSNAWTRVTGSNTLNGTACLQTIASSEGAIVFTNGAAAQSLMKSAMLEVTFWAEIAATGTGNPYCNVELLLGSTPVKLSPVVISGSGWQQYRICVPTLGASRVVSVQFGSSGTAIANIDGLAIGYRPYS